MSDVKINPMFVPLNVAAARRMPGGFEAVSMNPNKNSVTGLISCNSNKVYPAKLMYFALFTVKYSLLSYKRNSLMRKYVMSILVASGIAVTKKPATFVERDKGWKR